MSNKVNKQIKEEIKQLNEFKSKSEYIRYLTSIGKSRKDIVSIFADQGVKIRYQHVRNVQITPLTTKKD